MKLGAKRNDDRQIVYRRIDIFTEAKATDTNTDKATNPSIVKETVIDLLVEIAQRLWHTVQHS